MTAASRLAIGDTLPDVGLSGANGPVRLRGRLGSPLVVFFYSADDTFACTLMACALRDRHDRFVDAGATVVGVSPDDAASHARFVAAYRLPFQLLTDAGDTLAHAWGLRAFFSIGGRATFVFDSTGVLRERFESVLRLRSNVDRPLAAVQRLRGPATDAPR